MSVRLIAVDDDDDDDGDGDCRSVHEKASRCASAVVTAGAGEGARRCL